MITITRTPDAGTLAHGVGHRAMAATMLRRLGFTWSDDLRCWRMPGRTRRAHADLDASAEYLRAGGHQVRVVARRDHRA